MWSRQREAREAVRDRLEEEPEISQAEEDTTFLDIFITPDVYGEFATRNTIGFNEFVSLMKSAQSGSAAIPFDNFFTNQWGYVARQIETDRPPPSGPS
jgi:hypothetical protein